MRKILPLSLAFIAAGFIAGTSITSAAPDSFASTPSIDLSTGWTLLQEGTAQGTIEPDAKHPTNPSPHLLRITVTKTANPGEGRAGATSATTFPVTAGTFYDITFTAVTERGSIGLVFSLETADGKVLAATTLPEIGGRGRRRGPPTTAPAVWNKYLVALHARASDPAAHVVITPIEPTNIWLDGLTLTTRASGQ